MYRSYWGYGGGYPRGYMAAGIGYPYQPLLMYPYGGCYGYPGCGYGYGGYPYY